MNANLQVVCYQAALNRFDALRTAQLEGFEAVHCDFVKACTYDENDEQYTDLSD